MCKETTSAAAMDALLKVRSAIGDAQLKQKQTFADQAQPHVLKQVANRLDDSARHTGMTPELMSKGIDALHELHFRKVNWLVRGIASEMEDKVNFATGLTVLHHYGRRPEQDPEGMLFSSSVNATKRDIKEPPKRLLPGRK
jgi:hypothetical protein